MTEFAQEDENTMDALPNPTENVCDMCNLAAGSDLIKKAIQSIKHYPVIKFFLDNRIIPNLKRKKINDQK